MFASQHPDSLKISRSFAHSLLLILGAIVLTTGQAATAATSLNLLAYPIHEQVSLQWNKIKGASDYRVCYATESIRKMNECKTYANGTLKTTTNNQMKLTGMDNGVKYYFRVMARQNGTMLSLSTIVKAIPQPTLNDTGVSTIQCYQTGNDTLVVCNSPEALALSNSQDGMLGRDAHLATKAKSDGKAGFNYTKISDTGEELPASATSWDCVKDNATGLIWEVKSNDGGIRDWQKIYTNYGTGSQAATDASGLLASVNDQGLCGATDWRLPTAHESQGLIDYGSAYPNPMIDSAFFPNTRNTFYWSASDYTDNADYAWHASFGDGRIASSARFKQYAVRLVRTAQ